MGSYYSLFDRRCPHCKKVIDEIVYATYLEDYNADDEWMGNYHTCEHCDKKFKILMEFIFEKKYSDNNIL